MPKYYLLYKYDFAMRLIAVKLTTKSLDTDDRQKQVGDPIEIHSEDFELPIGELVKRYPCSNGKKLGEYINA